MSRGVQVQGSRGTGEQGSAEAGQNSPLHPCTSAPLHLAELTRLRQGLYRLFGALFLYPDRDRLATLRAVAGELQQEDDFWDDLAFSDRLRQLLEVLSGLSEGADLAIEEEYVRLFLVRPVAPPYESFYLDPEGMARGWISVQLEREYANAGVALAPSLHEAPDHIAVELEFMAFLCDQQARAWEEEALEDSVQARDRQCAFVGQHLIRWFPQFARQIRDGAPEALYGAVAEAAHVFLRYDWDLLQGRLTPEPPSTDSYLQY